MLSSRSHFLLSQNSRILAITSNSYSTKQNLQYPSSSLNFDLNLDFRRSQFRSKMSLNCTNTNISSSSNGIETVRLGVGIDEMDSFVQVGNKVADAAGEVIRSFFRKNFEIVDKEDLSPVTIADRTAEEAMVKIILENFPSHAIYGEENGWRYKDKTAEFVWVLDPIDGQRIVGIIDQPVLRERWIGVKGRKTTMNGEEVSTRACGKLSQAYLYDFLHVIP
ncbi:hypothetical protein C5167_047050 [Papaver somniferum]|uniref:Uncharacterized protein n=1 Tax=Papaver somniferum TaxID=3469 RepID=A0A4Y7LFH7_PAPSO|nr:hypothetical protein C5167_047050 [Papaver somniferum]